MKRLISVLLLLLVTTACAPSQPSVSLSVVEVYATSATQLWLSELYTCADSLSVTVNISSDAPDISIRLSAPADLTTPAFQIDSEDILIVVNRQSPLGNLTLEQARTIFSGQGNPAVQVWAYASDTDAQEVFDTVVMNGRSVTSFARLAVSVGQMSEALNADVNAVGILPRRSMVGNVHEVFVAATVPVLVITPSEPQGIVRDLIACLQKYGD